MMKLKDRVAVVTGGGGGIGEGICLKYATEGARLAVLDIDLQAAETVASKIRLQGAEALALVCDVANKESVDNAFAQVVNTYGQIDVLVNCAGISWIVAFLEHTEEIWDKTLDINLKGTFFCCQAAVRQMLEQGSGSVINFSSQSGKTGDSHHQAYCAAKFGIIGLTQSLSAEFAKKGLRFNAICPGPVMTKMWNEQNANYAKKKNMSPDEVKAHFERIIPLGRLCEIEDVAKMALYLACDDSSYITGQALNVSGGAVVF